MNTRTLKVFDPALCCSTGVCGPEVDDTLVRFAADVAWLKTQGVEVQRLNLAQEGGMFAANRVVQKALMGEGVSCLPLLMLDGQEIARGRYPTREELSRLTSVAGTMASPGLNARPISALPINPVGQGCAPDSGCC